MAGEKGSKWENESGRLSGEELAEVKEQLLQKKEQMVPEGYAAFLRAFLAYNNDTLEGVPEFAEIFKMKKHLKERGTLSSAEIDDRINRKKLDIYHKVVEGMLRFEKDLDLDEAKRIREKITLEFNSELLEAGKKPKLL